MGIRSWAHIVAIAVVLIAGTGPGCAKTPTTMPAETWGRHGLTQAQSERLRDVFRRGIQNKLIPGGSLLLIHKGEVVFREAFGLADIDSKRPFTTENLCYLASVTKPHTATVLAILADQGKLSLDKPIDTYLPEFKNLKLRSGQAVAAAPTIRQCLSHTTGFPSNDALRAGAFTIKLDDTLAEGVTDLATKPLGTMPGTRAAYGRFGYMMAGRAAEAVCDKPFWALMREVLLDPIGAKDTTPDPSADARKRIPTRYDRIEGGLDRSEHEGLARNTNPGAGLYSTLDGVGALLLLHRNKGIVSGRRIVSEKALAEMYIPQPGTRTMGGYGLGLNVMRRATAGRGPRVRHLGGIGTTAVIDFDLDVIIVMLTQVPQKQNVKFRQKVLGEIDAIFGGLRKRTQSK